MVKDVYISMKVDGLEAPSHIIRSITELSFTFRKNKASTGSMALIDPNFKFFDSDIFKKDTVLFFIIGWKDELFPVGPVVIKNSIPEGPESGQTKLNIEFQDLSHALNKKQKQKKWKGTPGSIIKTIAKNHNLGFVISEVEGVKFDEELSIVQANQTDASFMQKLALRYGYTWGVIGQNLVFQPPEDFEDRGLQKSVPVLSYKKGDFTARSFNFNIKFLKGGVRKSTSKEWSNISLNNRKPKVTIEDIDRYNAGEMTDEEIAEHQEKVASSLHSKGAYLDAFLQGGRPNSIASDVESYLDGTEDEGEARNLEHLSKEDQKLVIEERKAKKRRKKKWEQTKTSEEMNPVEKLAMDAKAVMFDAATGIFKESAPGHAIEAILDTAEQLNEKGLGGMVKSGASSLASKALGSFKAPSMDDLKELHESFESSNEFFNGDESGIASPFDEEEADRVQRSRVIRGRTTTEGDIVPSQASMYYVPNTSIILECDSSKLTGKFEVTEVIQTFKEGSNPFQTTLKVMKRIFHPLPKHIEALIREEKLIEAGSAEDRKYRDAGDESKKNQSPSDKRPPQPRVYMNLVTGKMYEMDKTPKKEVKKPPEKVDPLDIATQLGFNPEEDIGYI